MKGLGIKQLLRVTSLIPVTMVALLFAGFYNYQLSHTLDEHISHLGETYVNQLIPAAQLTILEGDTKSLQALVDSVATNSDIRAVSFYDANGRLLAYRGGTQPKKTRLLPPTASSAGEFIERKAVGDYRMRFFAPITLQHFNLFDQTHIPALTPGVLKHHSARHVLGWLSIDLDTKPIWIKKYVLYLTSILITLLGIAVGLLVHYFLAKKVHQPLAKLAQSMHQISNEAFDSSITTGTPGEVGIIEQGCADLQKAYLNTRDEFNQHVDTATQDLQQSLELLEEKNVQLLLDRRRAEEELKQKSILITSLSHEIRTPMNGIIGFANVLLETSLNPVARDHVKTIKSSAKDLLGILNNILDYSKINAGKLKLDTIPLDIRNCIDDVLAIAAPNAHKKGLDLIASTALDVPKTMVGDPLRIKQIINNLISNAIKFTHLGHIIIRTHVENISDKTYTIALSVTDTGIGISKKEQSALFHAFHQAKNPSERHYGGSGLGLVICKQLAEQMQGHISLESHPNQGTTFIVHLTFAKLPAYEVEKMGPKRFSHIKAICFDTNALYLEALCHGLGHLGIHCIQANTTTALEHALVQHPDAKLLFAHLTAENEATLIPLLKAQSIPYVLISKWVIENYQSLGAQGFLMQPPNIQKLQNTVESLLLQTAYPKQNERAVEALRDKLHALKPHLLIAEDNTVNQMLLNAWLSQHTVIDFVDNGEQALSICHQKKFDAILIDLHMPKLNGLEATKMIREKTALNKNTPVLLISADNHDLDRADLEKHKINRKLPKPIDENLLLHHLITVLQEAKSPAIHWALCIQKMSGNAKLAEEFLDRFVLELPKHQHELKEALIAEDSTRIEEIAHTLRGACGFCGVPRLEESLAKLEYLARHKEVYQILQKAIDEVCWHISEIIEMHHTVAFSME